MTWSEFLLHLDECPENLQQLLTKYALLLNLPVDHLYVTTNRKTYAQWLGRASIPSRYGGAYCFVKHRRRHCILINLDRIDQSQPMAVEVVVVEELVHMRDHLDGDHRRHAHHGHDRIAIRVAYLTGATLDEVRSALLPVKRRSPRYIYQCPGCGMQIPRKRKGIWSCLRCAPRFDRRYVLRIVADLHEEASLSADA